MAEKGKEGRERAFQVGREKRSQAMKCVIKLRE